MKNILRFYLILQISLTSCLVQADFTAQLFELETQSPRVLFEQSNKDYSSKDESYSQSLYKYPDGRLAVEETLYKDKEGRFKKYVISHKQINEKWMIEKVGHQLNFRRVYFDSGEVKRDSEDWTEDFVVGPTLVSYLRGRWNQLNKGESVKIRFGVPARRETVGFKFKKDADKTSQAKGQLVLKMTPSNFIISLLVDPIYLYFDVQAKRLLKVKGRTLPRKRKKDGGGWDELDVQTVFNYKKSEES